MTTKEKVLNMLIDSTTSSLSGEKLAAECGVSRAAIWKAVNALRAEGYQIEGTPNGGYQLSDEDIFTPELFHKSFTEAYPEYASCHTEAYKEIDSTNTYAKRLLAECGSLRAADGSLTDSGRKFHRAVIVAESQTAGRGRLGRSFISPEKTGIYLSVIYAPAGGITNPARLTAATAVAICRAVHKLFDFEPEIKWINDIFYGGKKICGILAEGVTNFESGLIESAIVGIGINLRENPQAFSGELANVAGAICDSKNEKGLKVSRCQLAAEIAGQVLKIYEEDLTNHKDIIEEYRRLSFLIGRKLTVHPLIGDDKSAYTATAIEIDEDARLIVELEDKSRRALNSGEVTLKSSENLNS